MRSKKLTKSRKKLLYLISENARIPYNKIAKECKTSPQNIRSKLLDIKDSLIPYTLVDYSMLNQLLFKVYFKGGFTEEKELISQTRQLAKSKLITEINELSGLYDLQVNFMAQNPSRFNKEVKELISIRPSLNYFEVVINVVSHIFPYSFLAYSPKINEGFIIGGDRTPKNLDDKQKAVLHILVEEPKATIVSIATKTKLNPRTIINIIKNLEEEKIIRGYKSDIKVEIIDYLYHRIALNLHHTSIERDKTLLNYCKNSNSITKFSKTVGRWDVEIDVITSTNKEFRKIYMDIRNEFKDIIQDFNYLSIENTFMKKTVSSEYFSE